MVAKSKTIRFERSGSVGSIVLANPPYNRIDTIYPIALRDSVHEASESDIRVLVVRAEGPNFSLGGEVRDWPGKDVNWFRTFVAEVNTSYRAIEALRVPTVIHEADAHPGLANRIVTSRTFWRYRGTFGSRCSTVDSNAS